MQCKICQHETRELVHPGNGQLFHECLNCQFIFKNPAFYLSSEKEFEQYEHHENSIEDTRYVAFFEKYLQAAVLPFVSDGKKAFDFGSGPSPVLAQILERDYDYHVTIYDLFYAPEKTYENQLYDVITTTEVMEHIPDPIETFKELKTLMKADAILVVMTLFHPKDDNKLWGWHYIRDFTHISFFTPEAMQILADKIGLEVIYCDDQRYTTFKLKQSDSII
ncbi:class I SAM-dependent methyltransferase [Alkalibacterium sp. f15]|uniref:class I SAM-dependent methyltransferase n=1 Tax=Alkalibacterium sp. f15 TaxID=3414029 RepID=UPI003BF8CDDB